jgi:hypothetical protein
VNPWVIGEVFHKQSRKWFEIAQYHLKQVFQAVEIYIVEALGTLMDSRTCNLLMLKQIKPELDRRWCNVELKLEELVVAYTQQDPITYDPGFLRDLEEMRVARYQARVGEQAKSFAFGQAQTTSNSGQRLLTESLDDFTNTEILDLVQTYYKVSIPALRLRGETRLTHRQGAISVFINNVAVLAIENCLIKDLGAIFSPMLTISMEDEQIQAIAAESEETRDKRTALRKKLSVLQSGRQALYEHKGKVFHYCLKCSNFI